LAASGTDTADVNYSDRLEGVVLTQNTPGGSISGTRGVKVEAFPIIGTSALVSTIPSHSMTMPSAVASTLESAAMPLKTGRYRIKWTNLDGTYSVTVGATSDTVDEIV
jgi:hypothetical protein